MSWEKEIENDLKWREEELAALRFAVSQSVVGGLGGRELVVGNQSRAGQLPSDIDEYRGSSFSGFGGECHVGPGCGESNGQLLCRQDGTQWIHLYNFGNL